MLVESHRAGAQEEVTIGQEGSIKLRFKKKTTSCAVNLSNYYFFVCFLQ